ncbi:hypothetical protein K502DRAFT_326567 [Neoconidiobolus thromboides FSU 785]|nr:hypothetical protein K502DRAFT_326567 [Neoconidiobolus thromboides FSU 785]
MGLSCGMMLGIAIGNLTGNTVAFITITVSLSFISGILSFFFKRIFEIIAPSVTGGFLFANGYRLIFIGATVILLDVDGLINYYYTIYISTSIIQISITLIFGIYHLIVYKREKKQFPPYSGPVAI